jgi:hypothetical protein
MNVLERLSAIEKNIGFLEKKIDYLTKIVENQILEPRKNRDTTVSNVLDATIARLRETDAVKKNPQMLEMVEQIFSPIKESIS